MTCHTAKFAVQMLYITILHITYHESRRKCYTSHVTQKIIHITFHTANVAHYMTHSKCYTLHVTQQMLHITCSIAHHISCVIVDRPVLVVPEVPVRPALHDLLTSSPRQRQAQEKTPRCCRDPHSVHVVAWWETSSDWQESEYGFTMSGSWSGYMIMINCPTLTTMSDTAKCF